MKIDTMAKEFAKIVGCDYCERHRYPKLLRDQEFNVPQPGYIGPNYNKSKVLLVGQNPGVSQNRFNRQDKEFSNTLNAVSEHPTRRNMVATQKMLERIIPSWPVTGNYFPLARIPLQLKDIAYINVVRCRTNENTAPSKKIVDACIQNHFIHWIEWLNPDVVVCIGKWAHDQVATILGSKAIPHGFVNRRRSLSTFERQDNMDNIVNLVRDVLSRSRSRSN